MTNTVYCAEIEIDRGMWFDEDERYSTHIVSACSKRLLNRTIERLCEDEEAEINFERYYTKQR